MFVLKADYKSRIAINLLNMILKDVPADTGDDLLTDADKTATDTITTFVGVLYDLTGEFEKAGTDRNFLLLRWAKDIAVYELYQRIDDEEVPEKVIKNYNDTMEELEKVANGKMNINLPPKVDGSGSSEGNGETVGTDGNGLRRMGSRKRRSNEI